MEESLNNQNIVTQLQERPVYRHHLFWLWLVLAIIVLGSTVVYASYNYYIKPEIAVPNAFTIGANSNRVHSDVSVTASASSTNPTTGDQISSASLFIKTNADKTTSPIKVQSTIDLNVGTTYSAAEIRFIDNIIYGRIVLLPAPYTEYAKDFINKWYSISLKTLEEAQSLMGQYDTASTTTQYPYGKTLREMYDNFTSKGILTNSRFEGFEYDDSLLVRHYSMSLDKESIIKELISQFQAYQPSISKTGSDVESVVSDELKGLSYDPLNVYVDWLTGALRKFTVGLNYKSEQVASTSLYIIPASDYSLRMEASYSDLPNDYVIETPINVTSLDSLVNGYLDQYPKSPTGASSAVTVATTTPVADLGQFNQSQSAAAAEAVGFIVSAVEKSFK